MECKSFVVVVDDDQQGMKSRNHKTTSTGSFTRITARFASRTQQMQQGHMQLNIILHLHNYEFLIYNLKDKYVKEKGICNRSMDSAI